MISTGRRKRSLRFDRSRYRERSLRFDRNRSSLRFDRNRSSQEIAHAVDVGDELLFRKISVLRNGDGGGNDGFGGSGGNKML